MVRVSLGFDLGFRVIVRVVNKVMVSVRETSIAIIIQNINSNR